MSLNYALLQNTVAEKRKAFKAIRDLYDLRSKIAHGGNISDSHLHIGNDEVSLNVAADLATEFLRRVVHRFLSLSANPPYLHADFWAKLYFE